jgi:hypothetical protein
MMTITLMLPTASSNWTPVGLKLIDVAQRSPSQPLYPVLSMTVKADDRHEIIHHHPLFQ